MGRYRTTDIKMKGSRTKKYRDILHTIATDKMLELGDDVIVREDGSLFWDMENILQGGYIVKYKSGELNISLFKYLLKSDKGKYISRGQFITHGEFLEYQRDENINQILGGESTLVNSRPRLQLPFEVKVGDHLFIHSCRDSDPIVVTSVTPRTFKYKYRYTNLYGEEVSRLSRKKDGTSEWRSRSGYGIVKERTELSIK